jgi:hypothetical protein
MLPELLQAVMLKLLIEAIVCANVTWVIDESRQIENIDWGNCLCKCYMRYFESPCWKYWLR